MADGALVPSDRDPDQPGWIFDTIPGRLTQDEPVPAGDPNAPNLENRRWSERVKPQRATAEEFPMHVLPEWMTDWSKSIAVETQSPVEMALSFSLVALSIVCAGRIDARTTMSRSEGLNLFMIVVLRPGSAKTAVLKATLAPIMDWEQRLRAEAVPQVARLQQERKMLERQLAAREKSQEAVTNKLDGVRKELESVEARIAEFAGGSTGSAEDLGAAEGRAAELRVQVGELTEAKERAAAESTEAAVQLMMMKPLYPRLLSDDVTPEALFRLMVENQGRMAVVSDEASGTFAHMGGRYSNESNTNIYTQGYSNGSLIGDRESDKRDNEPSAGRYVGRSWLTMCLATQLKVFADAMAKPEFRDRGVMDRFLLVKPDVPPGYKDHVEGFLMGRSPEARRAKQIYRERFDTLIASMPETLEEIEFPEEVGMRIAEWMNDVEVRQRAGGELEAVVGWAQKANGNCVRIIGLLHIATTFDEPGSWRQPVSLETVERAIELMEWYLFELARSTSTLVPRDELLGAVHEVLTRLKTCNPKYLEHGHTITLGNLAKYCGLPSEETDAELRHLVVETLKANDWLRQVDELGPQRSGRKTKRFVLHPDLRP